MLKKISFIISSENHPINSYVNTWAKINSSLFNIEIIRNSKDALGGDMCFLISCNEIVSPSILKKYKYSLVIHASNLPIGRGWSPHIWTILNNENEITISLLEASENVDTGNIWKKMKLKIERHLLNDEVMKIINKAHIDLINYAVNNSTNVIPELQDTSVKPTYFKKRTPSDSEISIDKSIKEQFNLIRICDPQRFPAFFEIHGCKYKLIIEKYEDD